jgi:hypothetical protein
MQHSVSVVKDGEPLAIPWGQSVTLRGDESTVEVPLITSVGLENLREVRHHHINHVLGSTSHVIQFHAGGYVQFSYTDQGQLLDLAGERFSATLDVAGRMTFSALKEQETPDC